MLHVVCIPFPYFHRNAQLYPAKYNQMPRRSPGQMRARPHTQTGRQDNLISRKTTAKLVVVPGWF